MILDLVAGFFCDGFCERLEVIAFKEFHLPALLAKQKMLMPMPRRDEGLTVHRLMYEAERNIPKDLNIDELVRDYRASLVRFNFEEQLIAEKLDSSVSEAETKAFYENNKDQFQLESTILKCKPIVKQDYLIDGSKNLYLHFQQGSKRLATTRKIGW